MLKHKMYGEVVVNAETKSLEKRFGNRSNKNGTMFVSCKGEIKEVSKDMIFEVTL